MNKIYFDHIAGSPVMGEAVKEMMPYITEEYGNPQSIHSWGGNTKGAIEVAREKIAKLIGADKKELYFTSTGTEGNNIIIKGIANSLKKKGNHIIISAIEHFSVLHTVKSLAKKGFEVTELQVDKEGRVDLEELKKLIRDDTILVSIQTASSEIGTIQPLKEISEILRNSETVFHTDAVAAVGHIPIDVKELGVDALTLAGQNFYGPKGSAAVFIRNGLKVMPLIEGGVQENGIRPGSENVPAIVGLGKAAEVSLNRMSDWNNKLITLRDRILSEIPAKVNNIYVTGSLKNRLPYHTSFCIEFIEGEGILLHLDMEGIAVSSGSACTSKALKASHVLLACGFDHALAQGSIVASLGIENSEEDIDYYINILPPIVKKLRSMSPLYAKYLKEKGDKDV